MFVWRHHGAAILDPSNDRLRKLHEAVGFRRTRSALYSPHYRGCWSRLDSSPGAGARASKGADVQDRAKYLRFHSKMSNGRSVG